MVQAEFGSQLIVANHHQDDMFEIPWVETRSNLYGAGCMPHVRIDGKFAIRGAQSCSWAAAQYRTAIQQRLAETEGVSPVEIAGAYFVGADSVYVAATFTLTESAALPDTRGYLLMLVDGLCWASVYYDRVTQGAHEQSVTLNQPDDEATIAAAFARQPGWDSDDIHCLAFIQCLSDSLEVHQATWLSEISARVPEDPAPAWRGRMWASPNPFPASRGLLRVGFAERVLQSTDMGLAGTPGGAAWGPVEVLDGQGRLVAQIGHDPSAGAGCVAQWDGRDGRGLPLPPGAYWIRARDGRAATATRVILVR